MSSTVILIVLAILTLGVSGANNSGTSAGTIAGSRILSYRSGILIFVAGLALGAFLEGGKLFGSIQGKTIEGNLPLTSVEIVLGVSLGMIVIATLLRLPIPVNQAIYGAAIGSGLFLGLPINQLFVVVVAISWGIIPFISAFASLLISKLLNGHTTKGLETTTVTFGLLTLVASFYTAYTFGANTLGLIIGVMEGDLGWPLSLLLAVVATSLGGILLGERVTKTVGEGIASMGPRTAFSSQFGCALTIHLFTQVGIPVSVSESITGGIAGSGLARGVKSISGQTAAKLAILWTATPIFSVILAWVLQAVIAG